MIKATGRTGDGRPFVLLGLSGENVTRLMADEPITVDLAASASREQSGSAATQLRSCGSRATATRSLAGPAGVPLPDLLLASGEPSEHRPYGTDGHVSGRERV